VLALIAKGL